MAIYGIKISKYGQTRLRNTQLKGVNPSDPVSDKDIYWIGISDIRSY